MPIEWKAGADTRRVEAVWTGTVSAEDWARFIEDMRKAGLVGQPKLHDLTLASLAINPAQMRELARLANAAADDQPLGPVAFIIDSARVLELVMQFDDGTAPSIRPIAVFPDRQLALEWLDSQSAAP